MTIPVELTDLPSHIARLGAHALLVTNSTDGPPHVASVIVTVDRDDLVMGAGRRSRANAVASPAVTLVWPEVDGEHCLIVDGTAGGGSAEPFRVRPASAILHRLATEPG